MIERRWTMRYLACAVAFGLALTAVRAADNAVEQRLRRDIDFLASDQCEGRGISTKGINLAADYVSRAFKEAGLKPAGPDGSYFQPFEISGPGRLEKPGLLVLRGPQGQEVSLKAGQDFQVLGLSGSGKVKAPVVFAGFGITATNTHYDDYGHANVAGKVVVVIRKTPRFNNKLTPFDEDMGPQHAALVTKMVNADLHKAAAVIFVNDQDLPRQGDALMPFGYTSRAAAAKLPAVHVRRAVANAMLKSTVGRDLLDVEKAIDRDLTPRSAPLKGWTATIEVNVKRTMIPTKNVVGVLEGAGPLAKETVVIGAHYDHLGYGGPGSLARERGKKQIHYGADDNGSGTTVLMEVARHFGKVPNRQGRRLLFIAFSGEESGLLGSEYYVNHPLYPLAETVAMVNMDMVGRLRNDPHTGKGKLDVMGTGTAKTFAALIDTLNKKYDFQIAKMPGGFGPSDHSSFYSKKIPVFFFFTGNHKDYHRPTDTADKINVAGMARIAEMVEDLVARLATVTDRPLYVKVKGGAPRMSPGVQGPVLGIMPSYSDTKEGVLIGGVRENGPAEKAGLKEGDRIVELGGQSVRNLEAYMFLMRKHKKGVPLDIGILRDGKKVKVKVTPQ